MIHVGLLRHGSVDGIDCFRGRTDTALSKAGHQQMWQTIESSPCQWRKIVSSPLTRCAEFATQYAKEHALPVDVVPAFEELNFGAWEGRTSEEIYAQDPAALSRFWQAPLTNTPPQGEPLSEFQDRVLTAWNHIVSGDLNKPVLIITHGGVIRVILSYLLERPVEKLLELQVPHASLHNVTLRNAVHHTKILHKATFTSHRASITRHTGQPIARNEAENYST